MENIEAIDLEDEMSILLNEKVEVGVLGSREDVDGLSCAAALDAGSVVVSVTGCILVVEGESGPEVVGGIVKDVCLEVDGIGSGTSTTTNE